MRAAWIVGTVISLVAGCGQDGVEIDTSSDNVCGEIAEVACHNLYQCCTEGEIEDYLEVSEPRTEAQCRDDLTRACERRIAALDDSIKGGRVTFDPEKINGCLTALVAPEDQCSVVLTELPWEEECMDSAWVGTVAIGGTCLFAHDCAGAPDTSFCAPNQKCTAKPTQGFPCGSGCAEGFYCATGICQPKQAEGSPCTSDTQCVEDLFCDPEAMPMPVCAAQQPGGAACTSDQACESGDCVPGRCMGSNTQCFTDQQCGSRCSISGFSCTTSANCGSGTCLAGQTTCTSDAQCQVANPTDVCQFPQTCLPGDCIGDPICTAQTLTVDYCTSTFSQLPVL